MKSASVRRGPHIVETNCLPDMERLIRKPNNYLLIWDRRALPQYSDVDAEIFKAVFGKRRMAGGQSRHRRTWPTPFDQKNKQNIRWIEREGHHPRKLVGQIREYLINRGLRRSSPLKAFFKDLDLTVCTLFKATSATKMLLNLRVTDFIVDQPRWHRDRGPATHAAVWTLIGAGTDYVPYGQVNKTAVKKVRTGDVAIWRVFGPQRPDLNLLHAEPRTTGEVRVTIIAFMYSDRQQ